MNDRIVLSSTREAYQEHFGKTRVRPPEGIRSTTPGDQAQFIHMRDGEIVGGAAVWGFVPQWHTSGETPACYAAGATISRKWTYSVAFRNWRCIMLATSLSCSRKVDGVTMQYELSRVGGGLMLLAGIYQPNLSQGGAQGPSFALITTMPNLILAPHGLQVPLLLNRKQMMPWLRSRTDIGLIKSFIRSAVDTSLSLKITVEPTPRLDIPVQGDLELA